MNNSILIRWDTFHINHRLLREERVGRQARHQIDREADDGPVSGVLDLRDVLKLIVDGLDQSPLAQEDFVRDCHKLALHVALKHCYQLDAVHETDARAGSHAASIHEQDEGDHLLTEIHQTFYDVNESSFLHLYFTDVGICVPSHIHRH